MKRGVQIIKIQYFPITFNSWNPVIVAYIFLSVRGFRHKPEAFLYSSRPSKFRERQLTHSMSSNDFEMNFANFPSGASPDTEKILDEPLDGGRKATYFWQRCIRAIRINFKFSCPYIQLRLAGHYNVYLKSG